MGKLNLDPKFEEIMKAYGIDTDVVTLNKNGSINCGEHGDWSCGNHYNESGVADFLIAYQVIDNRKSSWIFKNNKLEFVERINL